jgi:hypothetical protein
MRIHFAEAMLRRAALKWCVLPTALRISCIGWLFCCTIFSKVWTLALFAASIPKSLGAFLQNAEGKIMLSKYSSQAINLFLMAAFMAGCGRVQNAASISPSTSIPQADSITAMPTARPSSPTFDPSKYAFPGSIDPGKRYLFYLHGKIIEDQGIPAVSPEYGEYQYQAILEKLSSYGFVVLSEQRAKDADAMQYAKRISAQVTDLLEAGVPAKNITVVGASKGAGITIFVSHLLDNEEINYVIMAICDPVTVKELEQNGISLVGNVLSIYDSADQLAGSCQELFSFSEGRGIASHDEIVLNIGTGHGILFKALDEWITPAVQWAGKP